MVLTQSKSIHFPPPLPPPPGNRLLCWGYNVGKISKWYWLVRRSRLAPIDDFSCALFVNKEPVHRLTIHIWGLILDNHTQLSQAFS